MTTLHDRLSDLADEAVASPPPDGTWATGRRVHRRRQVGTAVVVAAALAALVGLGGLGWSQSRVTVEPAGTDTPLGMPDQIWLASEHLPGTDDTGPIGPLVAVVPAVRDTWLGSPSDALIGISATGEYAFLDLRHLLDPQLASPAISADGRYVAYWRTGTPSGAPGDQRIDSESGSPVGVAVYDTVTGETSEHVIETEHGLQPETLVWAGDRIWFDLWQMDAPRDDGGQSARRTEVVAWDPQADDVRSVAMSVDLDRATAWGQSLLTSHRDKLRRTTLDGTKTVGVVVSEVFDFETPFFVSPGGDRVAALRGPDAGTPAPVLVGPLREPGGAVPLTEVPSSSGGYRGPLIGWRDDEAVVTVEYGGGTGELTYLTVDVETGAAEILGYAEGNQPILAADALRGPVFEAPEPPHPLNPLLLYGGGAAIVLAAGVALLWWRRRVQR